LPIGTYQKFGPIPWNFLCLLLFFIVKDRVESQVLPNIIAVLAVNFNLRMERELNPKGLVGILLNFFSVSRLLITELVAREPYDFESFVLKLVVNLN
jgi:hypothetical protein